MDPTLVQILAGFFEAHKEIDRLQAELAQRDQRIADLEAAKSEAPGGPAT